MGDERPDIGACGLKAQRLEDMGRPGTLLAVGHLAGEDRLELRFGHGAAPEHTGPLQHGRRGDEQHGIHLGLGALLVEERDVEKHDVCAGVGEEGGPVGRDRRMDQRLEPGQGRGVGRDPVAERAAVHRAALERGRAEGRHRAHQRASGRVEPMDGGIGIPDRHAFLGEEGGRGGLAHADRAGQAEAEGPHVASTAARVSSSTSGRTPNQRSKPGAAWCRSIPSPSTVRQPAASASTRSRVRSGA